MSKHRVLVVDDEANMRRVLEIMLSRRGYRTLSAEDGRQALAMVQEHPVDLVISDLRMPGMNGIELLRELRKQGNDLPLIIITAQGTIESAVEAMRLGACDYLLRPFDNEALDLAIGRVFAVHEMQQQNQFLRGELDRNWDGLVGAGPAMQRVRQQIAQVAPTRASVLLTGETGTGKEVVARAIHRASPRREGLFVPINCAAIPAEILESELFGHEKGAFTGALKDRVGKFELAQGGTVFLDEITEMPIALQAKLLRVLQEGVIERLGGNSQIELDLRIIAATNRMPRQAVRDNLMREDLYYRLNVFNIELPPLRDRLEDLPELVRHFLGALHRGPNSHPGVTTHALEYLQQYRWPGNIRELGNMVERASILSGGGVLDLQHFPLDEAPPEQLASPADSASLPESLDLDAAVQDLEIRLINEALSQSGGNKTRAAQLLRISERSIWYKLKKYRLGSAAD